ncbi:MAG: adenylyl-sulfate kinase [Candidatus Eremiobacteraeota bacterium]|nr:adenylyl-sulfate kinase [Candidatus Eremiobacteraeota bacterium]
MLKSEAGEPKSGRSSNVVWESAEVTPEERGKLLGHGSQVVWFTGLSGSGKSTIARALERRLFQSGHHTFRLDGDNLRHGLNGDLGFSDEDRGENLRRAAETAKLAVEHGQIVIASFITPLESQRQLIRDIVSSERLSLFHVKCPLDLCRERDPKGLYEKAARGEIRRFTGLDAPFEEPLDAEVLDSSLQSVDDLVEQVLNSLRRRGILRDGT